MCSGFAEGHSAKTLKKPCFPSKSTNWSALDASKHALSPCSPASTTQPQLIHWLAAAAGSDPYHGAARAGPAQQRRSSAYQALPLTARLCEGPRGPMVSYFGTLTGFHSAPSQPIVSRRREHALDVLEREHGAGNVSRQILRFGPFF